MDLFAVSPGVATAYVIVLFVVLIIGPATVTALKGQWVLFVAGWLTVACRERLTLDRAGFSRG